MSMATSFRPTLNLGILVLLAGVLAPACSADAPMPTNAKAVFLHHSTGDYIWNAGVPGWFTRYNSDSSTSYTITQLLFPLAEAGYPYSNAPYDYWNIWVNHAGPSPYLGESTLEILTPQYDVIVFKHCYPVSSIGPDTGSPDIASPDQTIENYKLQYGALKTKLRSFPANRFIVWTGAAKAAPRTTLESATRAKEFFDWVRTEWDEPGDNIYVWDFFGLETDGGMYLTPEHAAAADDDHPSSAFSAEVAPLFAQRVVDVIQGKGDPTDTVPDYVVTDIRYDVDPIGWGWVHKAVIKNQGTASLQGSTVRWYVNGVLASSPTIGGIAAGDSTTSYLMLAAGDSIRVVCDALSQIGEGPTGEANNVRMETLERPDLAVTDLWWTPASPAVGDVVTFYAQVENTGPGGDKADYQVGFRVDGQVLTPGPVSDDIGLGRMAAAFPNADLESGNLTGWTNNTGGYTAATRSFPTGDRYYLSSADTGTGTIRSSMFTLSGERLQFSMTSGVSTTSLGVRLVRASDNVVLKTATARGAGWMNYVFDILPWAETSVYLEVFDNASSSAVSVDNVRMGSDENARTVVAQATTTWTATSGTHDVHAVADTLNVIGETSNTNNGYNKTIVIGLPDSGGGLSLALVGGNPVIGPVRLLLGLPVATQVELSIYDTAGRRVALLADGAFPAGAPELIWDNHAAGVTSGIYFARLKVGERELAQRIVILD